MRKPKTKLKPKKDDHTSGFKPISRQELYKLKVKWYKKLQSSGFNDVEIPFKRINDHHRVKYLKKSECIPQHLVSKLGYDGYMIYRDSKAVKIQALYNYITHNKKYINSFDYYVCENFCLGDSIRTIAHKFQQVACPYPIRGRQTKNTYSPYFIYMRMKPHIIVSFQWNCTDTEGLFYSEIHERSDEDEHREDIMECIKNNHLILTQ